MPKLIFPPRKTTINLFLPEGYPASVRGPYKPFIWWNLAQMTFSSALGVLSTQQLLLSLGIGSVSSSAALNWVMKDGLGQLGGVLFAGKVGRNFDVNVKHYRWVSSLVLNFSCALEMCSPFFPNYFLLIASLSTMGKNVSYLSASASKAAINLSFCNAHNLADLTAKNGTQTTAACLIGMGIGTSLAYFSPNFTTSSIAFAICSVLNLASTWAEMRYVTLRNVNIARGEVLARHFFATGVFLSPEIVNKREKFIWRRKIPGLKLCEQPQNLDSILETHTEETLESYLIHTSTDKRDVFLLFAETCSEAEALKGFFRALSVVYAKEIQHQVDLDTLPSDLERAGWDVRRVFLEPRSNRYRLAKGN